MKSVDNLAGLYRTEGKYAEAEPLVQEGADGKRKSPWTQPREVMTSLDDLAALYRTEGNVPKQNHCLRVYSQKKRESSA